MAFATCRTEAKRRRSLEHCPGRWRFWGDEQLCAPSCMIAPVLEPPMLYGKETIRALAGIVAITNGRGAHTTARVQAYSGSDRVDKRRLLWPLATSPSRFYKSVK